MATLIHKLNLLLLEFDSIKQLKTVLRIIFTKQLMNALIDFCMNTDQFAHFGVRLLEILSLEFHKEIVRSDSLAVVFGLLRTQDYETILQCMSFVKVLLQNALAEIPQTGQSSPSVSPASTSTQIGAVKVGDILKKKLLVLLLRNVVKTPEVEYIGIMIDIVNLIITDKEQRKLILESVLKEEDPSTTLIDDDAGPFNYKRLLKQVEAQQEIRAIKPLHKKVQRQLKELDLWASAASKPSVKSTNKY